MNNPFDNASITLLIQPPGCKPASYVKVEIDPSVWFESFAQLPRDRELAFASESRRQAARMTAMRKIYAEKIGHHLAAAMIEHANSQDTVNGYSRKEWDAMSPTGVPPTTPDEP